MNSVDIQECAVFHQAINLNIFWITQKSFHATEFHQVCIYSLNNRNDDTISLPESALEHKDYSKVNLNKKYISILN